MTIGSIQLAAYGKENQIINGNPQISFFKSVQKLHTHFARKTITLFPETSSPDRLSPFSTSKIRVKIPRHADLLHKLYLVVNIPDIYSHSSEGFRWVRAPGIAMIDKVVLRIGGETIQTLTREWLWIHSRYTLPLDKQDQWDRLVGNTPDMYNPRDPIKDAYPSSKTVEDLFLPRFRANSIPDLKQRIKRANLVSQPVVPSIIGRELRIPLPFFFHQNVGKSLPLVAIQYADVELEFHMRSYSELFTVRNIAYSIDQLRDNLNTDAISREVRYALEHDPPTPYVSPGKYASLTLSNGEPTSSNIIRYLAYNATFQNNSWNLGLKVEADYIYLKDNERRYFALNKHEFLVDDVHQEIRSVGNGESNVEYRIFHPVRQMFWWLQRSDVVNTNEWLNWTQFESADPFLDGIRDSLKAQHGVANPEYPIRAFQDTIEETLLGKDRVNPAQLWLQDEHLQRGVIPNFFLKGIFRSPQIADPTARQCLHILYRYGFRTRFGNWFLKRLQHITNVQHLAKLKKEAYEFMNIWKYRHPNDIPIITRSNYSSYLEHAMEKASIRIHNHRDGVEEEKSADYWNLATSWNFHPDGSPLPGLYCNSFALEPFADRPTGSLNTSMIDSITLKITVRDPPFESLVSDTSYNVNPFINERRSMRVIVEENETATNITGQTIRVPINPLTSVSDTSAANISNFTVDTNVSTFMKDVTDNLCNFFQTNLTTVLTDYVPQSNLQVNIPYGHYLYNVTAQEPTVENQNVTSIVWEAMMDDVIITNFEYYKESNLDYPQLIEKGEMTENKDPMEIYNDAAIRRAEIMDQQETRNTAAQQWTYSIGAIFHRWNVIRVENGMAHKVFAN